MHMRNVYGYPVTARAQRAFTRTNHGARMRARRIRNARNCYRFDSPPSPSGEGALCAMQTVAYVGADVLAPPASPIIARVVRAINDTPEGMALHFAQLGPMIPRARKVK